MSSGVALRAASRTRPTSISSRTRLELAVASGCDSIWRTLGRKPEIRPAAVGIATRAGAPLPISTSPARSRVISASRIAGRPTPKPPAGRVRAAAGRRA